MIQDKITEAQKTLRLAAEMSLHYYGKPLIICYSGGKDSDVMLDIAKRTLKPNEFEVLNAHTTVDAPETVYHIREVFKALEAQGVKTTIHKPTYKGEPTTMWKLIEQKQYPPTRLMRYCCSVLKEASTPNRMAAVGVRSDESRGRQGRDLFGVLGRRKEEGEFRSLQHTYAMYKIDLERTENSYECQFIKACKDNKDTLINPIYKFTEKDIWDYVEEFDVQMNPLYSKGYKRVGCIGCPLGGAKQQIHEFIDYPTYRRAYVRAFQRMLDRRDKERKRKYEFTTGEEVMRWWLGEDPRQIRIEDILKKG